MDDVSDDRLLLVNGYHQRDKSLIKYGGSWCPYFLPLAVDVVSVVGGIKVIWSLVFEGPEVFEHIS